MTEIIPQLNIVKQSEAKPPAKITFEDIMRTAQDYAEDRKAKKLPINIVDLAGKFGLSVEEFRQGKNIRTDKYCREAIKRCFLLCEADLNDRMLQGKPPIGLIFHAKNHYGYQDKQDISHELGIVVKRMVYDGVPASKRRKAGRPVKMKESNDSNE